MIDYIKLRSNKYIREEMINKDLFRYSPIKNKDRADVEFGNEITPKYEYNKMNLTIEYYPNSLSLYVSGKLSNYSFFRNTRYVLDDLWVGYYNRDTLPEYEEELGAFTDLNTIFDDINNKLYQLTNTKLDVRDFTVTRIDPCFNFKTFEPFRGYDGFKPKYEKLNYAGHYIQLFHKIFKLNPTKGYMNHQVERNLDRHGGFYLRTKTAYTKKNKDGKQVGSNEYRTTNFYCKGYQLQDAKNKAIEKGTYTNITDEAIQEGMNVLRLEVQMGNKELYNLKMNQRSLKYFIDIDWCRQQILNDYTKHISDDPYVDFVSYKKAQQIITTTDKLTPKVKSNLLKYIQELSQGGKPTSKAKNKHLIKLGIHWCFIPDKWNIEILQSPILLLDQSIAMMKEGYIKQRLLSNIPIDWQSIYSKQLKQELKEIYKDLTGQEVQEQQEDLSWLG